MKLPRWITKLLRPHFKGPGGAKSRLLRRRARKLGWRVLKVRVVRENPHDYRGYPRRGP
jgi:hypothetical protein